jgi:hypothetical protein
VTPGACCSPATPAAAAAAAAPPRGARRCGRAWRRAGAAPGVGCCRRGWRRLWGRRRRRDARGMSAGLGDRAGDAGRGLLSAALATAVGAAAQ